MFCVTKSPSVYVQSIEMIPLCFLPRLVTERNPLLPMIVKEFVINALLLPAFGVQSKYVFVSEKSVLFNPFLIDI